MWLALPFAVVLGFPLTVPAAAAEGGFDAPVRDRIEHAVRAELAAYGGKAPVPGALVGLWYPGHGIFVRAFGYGQLSPREPMALDDKFRIGSNTKTFVATVLLQLIDEGKLSLDDPVGKFDLPVRVPNAAHITVRQLMEMRSGLLDLYHLPALAALDLSPGQHFDRNVWVQRALDRPALFPPGAKYDYSNTNYMLLGMIVEAVAHDDVAAEIRNRLLVRFGLNETSFPTSDPEMPTPYAHGYMTDERGRWDDQSAVLPPGATWAAGAMVSNMDDMRRWVKIYVTGAANGSVTQRARLKCLPIGLANLSFGLGIGCSAGWYGYTGGITGYNTAAYYMPSKDATLIAFVNTQRGHKGKPDVANAIVRDIAKVVFPGNVPFAYY